MYQSGLSNLLQDQRPRICSRREQKPPDRTTLLQRWLKRADETRIRFSISNKLKDNNHYSWLGCLCDAAAQLGWGQWQGDTYHLGGEATRVIVPYRLAAYVGFFSRLGHTVGMTFSFEDTVDLRFIDSCIKHKLWEQNNVRIINHWFTATSLR